MRKVSSGEGMKNLCKISLKYVDIFSSDKRVKYLQRKEKCLKHFNVNELKSADEKPPEHPSNIEIRHSHSGWHQFCLLKIFFKSYVLLQIIAGIFLHLFVVHVLLHISLWHL